MNSLSLSTFSKLEDAADCAIRLDKAFTKAFNRNMLTELFAAASFSTDKRNDESRVELIARWHKENDVEVKKEIEWLKENL